MEKIEQLMDSLYSSEQSMIIFYSVLGGIALILIILIIITSIKIKKTDKVVNSNSLSNQGVSNEQNVNEVPKEDVTIQEFNNNQVYVKDELMSSNDMINIPVVEDVAAEKEPIESNVYLEKDENVSLEPEVQEEIKTNYEPEDYKFDDFKADTITNIDELLSNEVNKADAQPIQNKINNIDDLKNRLDGLRNINATPLVDEKTTENNKDLNDLMSSMGMVDDDMPKLNEDDMFKK